jgi:hypothetical protein
VRRAACPGGRALIHVQSLGRITTFRFSSLCQGRPPHVAHLLAYLGELGLSRLVGVIEKLLTSVGSSVSQWFRLPIFFCQEFALEGDERCEHYE